MRENRRSGAERPVNQRLFRRVGKMIGAANDVRDAHVYIVHDHAELIRGKPVRAQQHEIFDLRVLHFARTKHGILELRHSRARHAEPNRARYAGLFLGRALSVCQIAAGARNILLNLWAFIVAFAHFGLGTRGGGVPAGIRGSLAIAPEGGAARKQALRRGAV